jgi:hypothetical protein
MAGLLDFASGILDPQAFDNVPPIQKQQDVPIQGGYQPDLPAPTTSFRPNPNFVRGHDRAPMDFWSAKLLGEPMWSGPVEDRRYMTSPNNPFMKAADRFSMTKGAYMSNPPEAKLIAHLSREFAGGEPSAAAIEEAVANYVTAQSNVPAWRSIRQATQIIDHLRRQSQSRRLERNE